MHVHAFVSSCRWHFRADQVRPQPIGSLPFRPRNHQHHARIQVRHQMRVISLGLPGSTSHEICGPSIALSRLSLPLSLARSLARSLAKDFARIGASFRLEQSHLDRIWSELPEGGIPRERELACEGQRSAKTLKSCDDDDVCGYGNPAGIRCSTTSTPISR